MAQNTAQADPLQPVQDCCWLYVVQDIVQCTLRRAAHGVGSFWGKTVETKVSTCRRPFSSPTPSPPHEGMSPWCSLVDRTGGALQLVAPRGSHWRGSPTGGASNIARWWTSCSTICHRYHHLPHEGLPLPPAHHYITSAYLIIISDHYHLTASSHDDACPSIAMSAQSCLLNA